MAAYPRRFRVWSKEDPLAGDFRPVAYAEGVQFSDGTVALRYFGAVPGNVVYPDYGIDAVLMGYGYGGPCDIEWLDNAHDVPPALTTSPVPWR